MAKRFSSLFGVTTHQLEQAGAFDGFVGVDSLLYVDPHLIGSSDAPEFDGAHETLNSYFEDAATLLVASQFEGDVFWKEAWKRLIFKEIPQTALGHSSGDDKGSGIGKELARRVTRVGKAIIDAGTKDPDIFELVGLFQENVGPDRLSDMVVSVALPHFLAFSQRVAQQFAIPTGSMKCAGASYNVPLDQTSGRLLILVPKDVLRTIPVALSWSDVDLVAAENLELRNKVNKQIGDTWRKATTTLSKKQLLKVMLQHPALLQDLLAQYKAKNAIGYDFDKDPEALLLWHAITQALAAEFPLDLPKPSSFDEQSFLSRVELIVERFKFKVETQRLSVLLYNDNKTPRKEKIAQRAFFGIADAYCEAYNYDISPESDAGAGPVDFKVSVGFNARITVEVKLSSNQNLEHGLEKQLEAYASAGKAIGSIYLVIINGPHDKRIRKLRELHAAMSKGNPKVPTLIVVNGRMTPSASKLP